MTIDPRDLDGTHLRDARLRQALENAPDANERPRPATRNAIQDIAIKAIRVSHKAEVKVVLPWWQRLWDSLGAQRSPWGAVVATFLLGGIITLLWQREPIPDVAPDRPAQAIQAPVAIHPPATSPPLAKAPRTVAANETPMSELSEAKAPEQDVAKANSPLANADASLGAAPTSPAPVPARAAAPVVAPPAAAAMRAAKTDSVGATWTGATLFMNGQTVELTESQFSSLSRDLAKLLELSTQTAVSVPTSKPTLRLVTRNQNGNQGVLTLWSDVVQWQQTDKPELLRLTDTASAKAIQDQLAKLLTP